MKRNNKPLLSFDEMQDILNKKNNTMQLGVRASKSSSIRRMGVEDYQMLYGETAPKEIDVKRKYCKYKRKHCVWANNRNQQCVMPTCFYETIRF